MYTEVINLVIVFTSNIFLKSEVFSKMGIFESIELVLFSVFILVRG